MVTDFKLDKSANIIIGRKAAYSRSKITGTI
jgi:hypothetical protein